MERLSQDYLEHIRNLDLPADISLEAERAGVHENYDPRNFEGGGDFSDAEILHSLLNGHIRIYPFIRENLQGASYDVTLGKYFYITDRSRNRTDYNPHSQDDTERYFDGPYSAVSHEEWCDIQHRMPFENIPLEAEVIVLNPGERILAHTHEFIGIRPPGDTRMMARSSVGRNGTVVCKDAGKGDPGYLGRWTMEIQNDNEHERFPLIVGHRYSQILFVKTGPVLKDYGEDGKYYRKATLDEERWSPEMMVPRMYKDKIRKPIPLVEGIEVNIQTLKG